MPFPAITSFYTALMVLILLGLIYHVILGRLKHKVGLGDGGKNDLQQRIRMHGNFIETVPFLILIMMFLEMRGLQEYLLHIYGVLMILSRGLHAWGLKKTANTSKERFAGSILTHLLLLLGSILCILYFVFD